MRAAPVLVLLGLSACTPDAARSGPPDGGGLSDRIAAHVEAGDGAIVDLAALEPSAWTQFCAFPPYTTRTAAEEALGFRWTYQWSGIEHADDRTYLVLVDDGVVVSAFDHPRDRGDFAGSGPACTDRADARFVVRTEGQLGSGEPHHVLTAVR